MIRDCSYTHSDGELDELRELCLAGYAAGHKPSNWRVAMVENWSYASRYLEPPEYFTGRVHTWRTAAGQLVGAVIRYWDQAWPQLLPGYEYLADEMLGWVERNWGGSEAQVVTMAYDHDVERQSLLRLRGYEDRGTVEIARVYDLAHASPEHELPSGFRFTTLAEDGRCAERISLENALWGTSLDEAWFRGKSSAPHYSFDWDLLILSPEGRQAACCLVWLDHVTKIGEVDPIGTHPDYRRMGLARALVGESLRRMSAAGVRVCFIACDADDPVANHLYGSLGPAETYRGNCWVRRLAAGASDAPSVAPGA
ncbi:MAG TPA: GNAT family N-acetyltransferase [Anaerolineae bacterium]|nr:GNAT family N-acetyltransferase [Anaerolineae bacterium]